MCTACSPYWDYDVEHVKAKALLVHSCILLNPRMQRLSFLFFFLNWQCHEILQHSFMQKIHYRKLGAPAQLLLHCVCRWLKNKSWCSCWSCYSNDTHGILQGHQAAHPACVLTLHRGREKVMACPSLMRYIFQDSCITIQWGGDSKRACFGQCL